MGREEIRGGSIEGVRREKKKKEREEVRGLTVRKTKDMKENIVSKTRRI